jgi:hypothetical protein
MPEPSFLISTESSFLIYYSLFLSKFFLEGSFMNIIIKPKHKHIRETRIKASYQPKASSIVAVKELKAVPKYDPTKNMLFALPFCSCGK